MKQKKKERILIKMMAGFLGLILAINPILANTCSSHVLPILKGDNGLILFISNPGPKTHKEGNVYVHENSDHIDSVRLVLW